MSRNPAEDFAQRLYSRLPGHYRVYDAERGQPLLALMRVVGAQVANVRQDLDALWDNFFIETCDDWVVPYIGSASRSQSAAAAGGPEQSPRCMEHRDVAAKQRHSANAAGIVDCGERLADRTGGILSFAGVVAEPESCAPRSRVDALTFAIPRNLHLIGQAADPFAHAADFKPAQAVNSPPVPRNSLGLGSARVGNAGTISGQ